VCICQIDSRILVFRGNRLKILWFLDSRFFGSPRQINELGDSLLIGPDRPYTTGLRDHGLLETIPPDGAVQGAPNYYPSFVTLLDSLDLKAGHVPLAGRKTVRVHVAKTGYGLASELVGRELATLISGEEWDAWFDVERRTGNLLMAYLATIVGQQQTERMTPITDSAECLEAITWIPTGEGGVNARLDPIRTEILAEILPAPIDPVHPADLAQFKERHGKQLAAFRAAVEQRVALVAAIEDPQLRAHSTGLVTTELKEQLKEITSRMEEHNWHRIGFGTLLAVAAGGVTAADAVVTGGMLTCAGASLGLTSAVYSAFEGARTPADLLVHPMGYAALAHRQLGG
jgi:hypothetical protein